MPQAIYYRCFPMKTKDSSYYYFSDAKRKTKQNKTVFLSSFIVPIIEQITGKSFASSILRASQNSENVLNI